MTERSERGARSGRPSSATRSPLDRRDAPPSEYEIVTSGLHPYVDRGFEVDVPIASWYARYQAGSPLRCTRWEAFADPRETTYASYVQDKNLQEQAVDAILSAIETTGYDHELQSGWVTELADTISAIRFPLHGFYMAAAYVAQMAPSSRLTIAGLFQAADELRRIERFAYCLRLLQRRDPALGARGRVIWQSDAAWQPLRETIERLLVAYDWGEALVGLGLCVKPMLDELIGVQWARRATRQGDPRFAALLAALHGDSQWQRAWCRAAIDLAIAETPASRVAIQRWIECWHDHGAAAIRAVAPAFALDHTAVADIAAMHEHLVAGIAGPAERAQ